jgi:hypothetical protein
MKQKSQENTKTSALKRPPGVTILAWIIIAETILEFGLGIFEILPLLQSSNTTAIAVRNSLFLYETGVSVLKLLIAISLFRGINLARLSWVVFGLLLFGLNEWDAWRGMMVIPGQHSVSNVYFFTEIMKYFWIGTLFFLFKANMNAYFKGVPYSKVNHDSQQEIEQ